MPDKIPIKCSRSHCNNQKPVVKRWLSGIGPYPALVVYLCDDCKDIPLWSEDIVKEERL